MGFGDPCHKHCLKLRKIPGENEWYNKRDKVTIKCFHCEFQIKGSDGLSCSRCDYWVHKKCIELPRFMFHPLHPQHILTLTRDATDTTNLCNGCRNPCIGGSYSYQCNACHFFLHPKCFYTYKHEKHNHTLSFSKNNNGYNLCGICGYLVYDSNFGCRKCWYYIHHDCSLIPSTVKHHHVHELTIRHDFPKECDQVYCDICEDKDGKEIDRKLSYYYCKKCDYIAHVRCVTQQKNDVFLVERSMHEHPLRLVRDLMINDYFAFKLGCEQCNEVFDDESLLFPSLIKHPLHPDHTLAWLFDDNYGLFKCTDCEYSLPKGAAVFFTHPIVGQFVRFSCDRILFGCDACGELGKGCRMNYNADDFHLECFALPGKLEHESHADHPLYLLGREEYTYYSCNICNEEIDQELWKYYCQECDYVAHLNCVASGLLSTLRSSIKNETRFCAILEPDKTSFDYQIANTKPPEILSCSGPQHLSRSGLMILLQDKKASENDVKLKAIWDTSTFTKDLGIKEAGNVLCCPKCDKLVCTPTKYSSIQDWESSHFSEFETLVNELSPSKFEPLTLLSEQQIDDLYCPICSMLIFPPTYSCSSCQIYFHKSCANIPRKIHILNRIHVLVEPPFPDNLPSCTQCQYPVTGYAYIASNGGSVLDVHCTFSAPLIKQVIDGHRMFSFRLRNKVTLCKSCDTSIVDGVPMFRCVDDNCLFYVHAECALLPRIIQHKVHKHPLELVYNLAELDDEYICDACEKGLNPNLAAYRCADTCKGYATSHVTCVITSKKKCRFKYDMECQEMTRTKIWEFMTGM